MRSLEKGDISVVDGQFADFRAKDKQTTGYSAATVFLMACLYLCVFLLVRNGVSISEVWFEIGYGKLLFGSEVGSGFEGLGAHTH